MNKITVGIPRALLYYHYKDLWIPFLKKLNVTTILSDNTNKLIISDGENKCIDEACLSLKIYLGHIKNLLGRCDYILVPRLYSIKKKEQVCTNFNAIYDIVNNLYKNTSIIEYNIDLDKNKTELKAFIHLGEQLGFSYIESFAAYNYAKKEEQELYKKKISNKKINPNKLKVLVAGHPYNLYDSYISKEIIKYLNDNDIDILYSDTINKDIIDEESKDISEDIHWTHNKEIVASINYYKDKVDGIILISSFPCGPDSLMAEMIKRKITLPLLHLIFENSNSNEAIMTRLESFFDILSSKKEIIYERNN